MNKNIPMIIDELAKKQKKNKLILKNLINYISKEFIFYVGKMQHVWYFYNFYKYSSEKREKLIILQQQFALYGQMKILKKWKVNFYNVILMKFCNQLIGYTLKEAQIWKIDNSHNLSFVKTILTFGVEFMDDYFWTPIQIKYLLLSENDDIIITTIKKNIYSLIKKHNENWKFQQRLNDTGYDEFIHDYQLNAQGNILIVSYQKQRQAVQILFDYYLAIFLRVDEQWIRIKQSQQIPYPKYFNLCFLDNDQFALLQNDTNQVVLQLWQVITETSEAKLLQQQELKVTWISKIRFIKEKNLLMAMNMSTIYFISLYNLECQIQQKIKFPQVGNEILIYRKSSIQLENLNNNNILIFNYKRENSVLKLLEN